MGDLEYGQMSSHMRRSELAKLAFGEREGEKYVERERELPAFSGPAKTRTNDFRPENETDARAWV